MDLPVVFAKKKSPKTIQNALSTTVHSFTKDRDYEVVISADFLTPNDNVLFVDDFLAYGNAALGILDLIKQSGANLVGMGFIIEKAFQNGRKILEKKRSTCRKFSNHRGFIQLQHKNEGLILIGIEIMPFSFGPFPILHRLLGTNMVTRQTRGATSSPNRLPILH